MRTTGKIFYCILASSIVFSCNQTEMNSTVQIKKLDYPSASSVEYFNDKLYVMGDDATNLLVLDTNFKIIDSIHMTSYPGKRIPKEIKPDLEASTLYIHGYNEILLFFGSLSTHQRNHCVWYDFKKKTIDSTSLDHLNSKIKALGIEQVNIEGICIVNDELLMANRGNKSYPKNFLLISRKDLWKTDTSYDVRPIPVITQEDTSFFAGISGLHYSEKSDQLIMSVSTEDTRSVHEDGTIGKSYLWIIENISSKLNSMSISPDKIIDLETIDPRFKDQKIEEAAVIEETKDFMRLVLVADNDDGSSTIFKMSLKKN